MRISTGMIFDSGVTAMQLRTASLLNTQQQLASGRRILTPSDDPVAAARALEITQAQSLNAGYGAAQTNAQGSLGLIDTQLSSVGSLLTRIQQLTVQAGNASLSSNDRASIATELRASYDQLVGIANSTDGTGQYLFSGYQGNNKPFSGSVANGVVYQGDNGQRSLRVSSSRDLPVSSSGSDIFMNIKNGNGAFVTSAQAQHSANASTVSVDNTSVTGALTPANLELKFWNDPAVKGTATGTVDLSAGIPITTGTGGNDTFTINLDGGATKTVTLPGAPFTLDNTGPSLTLLQTAIDTAVGAGKATASFDAGNHLVVTSNTAGAGSSVVVAGNSSILGAIPVSSGPTFYDLVDTATGNSVFSGGTSTPGGAGYTGHVYTSGVPITLATYGGTIAVTGAAQTGDTFSIAVTSSAITATPKTLAVTAARATINAGSVTDSVKWSTAANSGNLEVRFWVDTANAKGGGAGQTYYDLVDAKTGNSAFITPATKSNPGGAGYTGHAYSSGVAISLSNVAAPAFDYGATVTVSGTPATGDTFTIKSNTAVSGNGTFVTAPKMVAAANTGSGIVSTGEVLDAAKWNSSANSGNLQVRFWNNTTVNPPVLNYDLVDATTEKSLFTNTASVSGGAGNTFTHTFTSGDSIPFSGLVAPYHDFGASVTITGTPASGDVFSLNKSTNQSVFDTLGQLINALESPAATVGSSGNAALSNQVNTALNNLGMAQDNILRVRSGVGSSLKEITSLDTTLQNTDLQYSAALSGLQDIDYTKAITDLTRQQTQLQAAQQSFAKISQLSLFTYL